MSIKNKIFLRVTFSSILFKNVSYVTCNRTITFQNFFVISYRCCFTSFPVSCSWPGKMDQRRERPKRSYPNWCSSDLLQLLVEVSKSLTCLQGPLRCFYNRLSSILETSPIIHQYLRFLCFDENLCRPWGQYTQGDPECFIRKAWQGRKKVGRKRECFQRIKVNRSGWQGSSKELKLTLTIQCTGHMIENFLSCEKNLKSHKSF